MFSGAYKRHENHIIPYGKAKGILRAAAIYGTNGSGKSNILCAIEFLHELIIKGTRDISAKLNVSVFKLSDCKNIPTKFEIDFLHLSKRYSYKLEILNDIIINEELYEIRKSEIIIFTRKFDGKKTTLTIAPNRNKDAKEKLREEIYGEELRENQTFFKEALNKKIVEVIQPYGWFTKIKLIGLGENGYNLFSVGLASTFLRDEAFLNASRKIISEAKMGIADFKLVTYSYSDLKVRGFELSPGIESELINSDLNIDTVFEGDLFSSYKDKSELRFVKISTIHKGHDGNDVEFKFMEESRGIQRLFELLPAIHRALHNGAICIVDEIETSFHPALLKEIMFLYLEGKPTNSGQIIFTTHESHLLDLDLFRQDEIWFCQKNEFGYTKLYSLAEFKPRFDKDIRKGYLEGLFGHIPFLGDRAKLEL